jgi:methionyl-tRNA synthetase
MGKFYITTAIDYVNARPHLGHAYEKILADVIARWHRLLGEDVLFLTGTDENAQKNEQAAREAGVPVREFVEKNTKLFREMCRVLRISNDDFIRTTEARHVRVARDVFRRVLETGDIHPGDYEGLYCEGCEAYITEKELVNGKCPEHNEEPMHLMQPSWFFKMSRYTSQVERLLSKPGFVVPESRRREMLNRVKEEGLKDLCVSRYAKNQSAEASRKEWGIDTPTDPGRGYHKIYVWFDALVNYISALDYPDSPRFRRYWPADVHMIGKGINWFHSVIWPSMLMSAGIERPKKIAVHGYITVNGKKLSKRLGNAIDPFEVARRYPVDAVRYHLIRDIPFGEDGDFSEDALKARINGELVADLGNLVSRVLKLAGGYRGSLAGKDELGRHLRLGKIGKHMEELELHRALEEIWSFIRACNKYINDREPWKLRGRELGAVLYNLLEALRVVSMLVEPFLPGTAERLRKQLRVKPGTIRECRFRESAARPGKGEHLFKRVK